MGPSQVRLLLDRCLIQGHFILSSGLHSPYYNETAKLTEVPEDCIEVVSALTALFKEIGYDVILSPAMGGIIFGYEFARQTTKRFVFCERTPSGNLVVRRAQELSQADRVLVVDNVFTTGRTLRESMNCIIDAGGICVGACYIVDRSNSIYKHDFNFPIRSLIKRTLPAFSSTDCPLCAAKLDTESKGSRPMIMRKVSDIA